MFEIYYSVYGCKQETVERFVCYEEALDVYNELLTTEDVYSVSLVEGDE